MDGKYLYDNSNICLASALVPRGSEIEKLHYPRPWINTSLNGGRSKMLPVRMAPSH
jgi:hypothetical protein